LILATSTSEMLKTSQYTLVTSMRQCHQRSLETSSLVDDSL